MQKRSRSPGLVQLVCVECEGLQRSAGGLGSRGRFRLVVAKCVMHEEVVTKVVDTMILPRRENTEKKRTLAGFQHFPILLCVNTQSSERTSDILGIKVLVRGGGEG